MATSEVQINSNINEKLAALGPDLNLAEAPPIHQKRLVTFFNHFLVIMVDFLNDFSETCTHKLFLLDQKMLKVEAELRLLEIKLKSIPELDDSKDVNVVLPPPSELSTEPTDVVDQVEPSSSPAPPLNQETPVEVQDEPKELNPEVAKYVKMVHVGVPVDAVKIQMRADGVDPDLLIL